MRCAHTCKRFPWFIVQTITKNHIQLDIENDKTFKNHNIQYRNSVVIKHLIDENNFFYNRESPLVKIFTLSYPEKMFELKNNLILLEKKTNN